MIISTPQIPWSIHPPHSKAFNMFSDGMFVLCWKYAVLFLIASCKKKDRENFSEKSRTQKKLKIILKAQRLAKGLSDKFFHSSI